MPSIVDDLVRRTVAHICEPRRCTLRSRPGSRVACRPIPARGSRPLPADILADLMPEGAARASDTRRATQSFGGRGTGGWSARRYAMARALARAENAAERAFLRRRL